MGLIVLAFLAAYWYSFIRVWKSGFVAIGWIRANRIMALLLLVPGLIVLAGFYYFMIMDWPMNIGGKPNNTLYHNLPAWTVDPMVGQVAVGVGVCAYVGVLPSWMYLLWRIRKTRRTATITPP